MTKAIDGIAVEDGKRSIKLHITDADVRGARRNLKDPSTCVAAQAVRRCLHAHEVRVHLDRTYIRQTSTSLWVRYKTPENLSRELIAFDRGGRFEPGTFHLQKIEPRHRIGMQPKGRPTGPGLTRRPPPRVLKDVRHGPA